MFHISIDSEEIGCALAPGQFHEELVDLPPGSYQFNLSVGQDYSLEEHGCFYLEIFAQGQRVGSANSKEWFLTTTLHLPGKYELKLKVSRGPAKNSAKRHFRVSIYGKALYGI